MAYKPPIRDIRDGSLSFLAVLLNDVDESVAASAPARFALRAFLASCDGPSEHGPHSFVAVSSSTPFDPSCRVSVLPRRSRITPARACVVSGTPCAVPGHIFFVWFAGVSLHQAPLFFLSSALPL
ncbi:hypothetical protein HYPSUDRAFT_448633 [Hypholoma sublateritium FD-334 SS-4]|uniref:Uncharacterized protein n=1 Tax=Hypholoma sublateritium (strain FD-334 SS-4) TaxID=945553 RepID=A0A0D2KI64_HYPSF|nr:hypothetical protein HYPSUDRAFT_448633 [Hypholoma sublateritium FD-334 SS-4]